MAPLPIPEGSVCRGRRGAEYTVGPQITSNRFGISYIGFGPEGGKVFLKAPSIDQEQPRLVQAQRAAKVYESFQSAMDMRKRLKRVAGVAHILNTSFYEGPGLEDDEDDELSIPILVQEYIDGIPLRKYLEINFHSPPFGFTGIPHQHEWISLSRRILEIIRRVHNNSVVHGDIWPENIIMREDEPVLVDFGQSFLVDEVFHQPGGRVGPRTYRAPERVMPDERWGESADIYSAGGLLFYLATGEAPPEASRDVETLKQVVHDRLRQRNPSLLRENLGIIKVIDKCLRFDIVDRYAYIDNVIEALDIFDYSRPVSTPSVDDVVAELTDELRRVASSSTPLFTDLALAELDSWRRGVDRMLRGHFEVTAEREELVNSLLRYLRVLDPGDEYLTLTVPAFWSEDNLGINGRFLMMNQMMGLRGVIVRRVFILCEDDLDDPATEAILNAHVRACNELEADGVFTGERALPSSHQQSYWTGYVILSPDDRDAILSQQHVAIWRKPTTGELVSIIFYRRPETGKIGKVRFWASSSLQTEVDEFIRIIDKSEHVSFAMEGLREVRSAAEGAGDG